jgi:acetylglutamate kinase
MMNSLERSAVLIEALPYIQAFRGKVFLIKVGGSAMEDQALVDSLLRDIVFLEAVGINPVVVHGGGKAISAAMKASGLEARFVGGLRVTDEKAIAIVEETLSREINPGLVARINEFGGKAVGLPGNRVFLGRRVPGHDPESGKEIDLGFVGEVVDFQLTDVVEAVHSEVVPVLSPIARELDGGHTLNINADIAAAALAGRLKVAKLIFLSDVLGVMRNPADPSSLISTLTESSAAELTRAGVISGGMIPKVRSAFDALHAGVEKVHMIDGRIPHSLILEIFTDPGIGTEIVP